MKKKILILLFLLVLPLLNSCGKEKLTNFQRLVKNIYDSEQILAGYNESNIIKDGDFEIYNKNTSFKLERGEKTKTEVTIVEKTLSASGVDTYDVNTTSYRTVDNVKYTEVNGNVYENDYEMPTYYLTFVLSEDFFETYDLVVENNDFSLSGKIVQNKISSLFLNKSVNSITNLTVEISIKDNKLESFKANYVSTTGNVVEMYTTYLYATKGQAKAIFYLEGGTCQNTKDRVSYVYSFDGTKTDMLIVDPNVLEKNEQDQITMNGYHIEGWYQRKVENSDGTVEYFDKWDFSKDRMSINGVTLYAKWEINRIYSYEVYYYENGNEIFLDSYEVKKGEKFNSLFVETEVDGYTTLGYLDHSGKPWDENYAHPGGDADVAIKVYLNLIEGEYTVVKTKRQLTSALSRNENIYLLADIDFDGDDMCFDSYTGTILGNGHTISNFEIDYDSSRNGLKVELDENGNLSEEAQRANHLYISLFFELKNAVIKDLNFSDVIIDVNTSYSQIEVIVVSPLAIVASNVLIENVNLSGNITFSKTPDCEIKVEKEKFFYYSGSDVIINNSSANVVEN